MYNPSRLSRFLPGKSLIFQGVCDVWRQETQHSPPSGSASQRRRWHRLVPPPDETSIHARRLTDPRRVMTKTRCLCTGTMANPGRFSAGSSFHQSDIAVITDARALTELMALNDTLNASKKARNDGSANVMSEHASAMPAISKPRRVLVGRRIAATSRCPKPRWWSSAPLPPQQNAVPCKGPPIQMPTSMLRCCFKL